VLLLLSESEKPSKANPVKQKHSAPFLTFFCPKNAISSLSAQCIHPIHVADQPNHSQRRCRRTVSSHRRRPLHRKPQERTPPPFHESRPPQRSAEASPSIPFMIHGHRGAAQELLLPSLSRFTAQRKSSSIPFTIHEHLHPFVDSRLPRRSSGSPRPLSRFTVVTAPQAIHDHHRTNNHTGFESSLRFHFCCFL